jgi:hypothetical protein
VGGPEAPWEVSATDAFFGELFLRAARPFRKDRFHLVHRQKSAARYQLTLEEIRNCLEGLDARPNLPGIASAGCRHPFQAVRPECIELGFFIAAFASMPEVLRPNIKHLRYPLRNCLSISFLLSERPSIDQRQSPGQQGDNT